VYLSGLLPAHQRPLAAMGVLRQLDGYVFADAPQALHAAKGRTRSQPEPDATPA
jgi:hypothetical protein